MAVAVERAHEKRWHDRYPELGTGPIPLEPYISEDYFERERDRIFRKLWLNVGRVEQLAGPGTYFVKDLAVCGTSIVVARAEDGALRAFHNMCSHRGNQLVWDAKGACKTFSCKFHGWVYGLDGSLRHIVDEGKFFDVDRDTLGLTHVSVDTWEGFVFVNLDPHPTQSLAEYLGPELRESVKGYPFADLSVDCVSWQTDVNANWKAVKDAFQEVYHIPTLHRRTIGNVFASKDNPHANALDFKLFGPHGRISLAANPDRPQTRVEEMAQKYGSMVVQQNVEADALPEGVNPTGYPNWSFDGLMLFPNTLIYVSQGTYLTHIFWPLSATRTRWEIRNYAPKAKTMAGRFSQEYGKTSFRDTLLEDGSTLEKTQAMLASGARQEIVLQDEELLIRHHHHVTEAFLSAPESAST